MSGRWLHCDVEAGKSDACVMDPSRLLFGASSAWYANPWNGPSLTAGDDQEETGWKYIHGDVFRFPPYRNVFCAFVGTGSQLLTLSVCIFALVRWRAVLSPARPT